MIEYLNSKTGKNFRKVEGNKKNIFARIEDGYSLDNLLTVIDNKILDIYFIENSQYLNPETLYRKSKFEKYLNQESKKKISEFDPEYQRQPRINTVHQAQVVSMEQRAQRLLKKKNEGILEWHKRRFR